MSSLNYPKAKCKPQPIELVCNTAPTPQLMLQDIFYNFEAQCGQANKVKEEENSMTQNNERNYLNCRVNDVYYNHASALRKQFHVGENTGPQTYAELIKWIKDGKYTLDAKVTKKIDAIVEDEVYFGTPTDGIVWNGRGFTNDFDGYHAAMKVLETAKQDALDDINGYEFVDGNVLDKFKSWVYKPKKNKAEED